MDRRFFLRLSAMAAATSLARWQFPVSALAGKSAGELDVIVVGAGLGGLTCAAYLARNGFKPLLLEQYHMPGGYASSFTRPSDKGDFTCEVSLHSSSFHAPSMAAMLTDLDLWDKLDMAEHPSAWSSRFPDFTLSVPAKAGLDGFERQLTALFPDQASGLARYFAVWRGVQEETARLDAELPGMDKSRFPEVFTNLWYIHDKSIGQVVDDHINDPALKAVLTQSCGYYGLPPSRLSAFFYLEPTAQYLRYGGAYLKGTSRTLSEALANATTRAGGVIKYGARVDSILVEKGRAVGVKTADSAEYRASAVVCNASAPQLFGSMLPAGTLPGEAQQKIDTYTYSPGSFIVWLGLDQNIAPRFPDGELSYYRSTDLEAGYKYAMACDFEHAGFSLMVYDSLVPGFSPRGCTSISIITLCDASHWQQFEADYLAGRKDAYHAEKARLTDLLISQVEQHAIPGLSKMIVMKESATPLTNLRYTRNPAGAIYGYNQTVDNSFMSRISNKTGVPGLYLASAWGNPGGGYAGAMLGGKSAFRDLAKALIHTA